MGGENWKKLSQNSDRESEHGNTSCLESVSGILGPTNITNLYLYNFHFPHVMLFRMNSKIGKQHGRYVLDHTPMALCSGNLTD